ncbi:MAG: alpha/beta hydrolase domain-containing protein [Gammaproteobacteria bacterium]
MYFLIRGLIVPVFFVLVSFAANAADALPTTRLMPVVTESESGEPLSAAERSTPFLAHLGDLGEFDYVEEEYEMSGTGNIYDYVDNEAQSPELAISESDIPYVTRMLVRRPADPGAFNGTVYVEILNSTAHWDDDPIWRMSYPSFVNAGSAYVGITSDPLTVNFLRNRWGLPEFADRNRDRYQNLDMERLGQVWDILSQGAALLKDDENPENPMMGFGVERIIQTGYSQSAGFQKTYANSMHSRDLEQYGFALYDGYFLGAGGFSAKKINPPPLGEGDDFLGFGDMRRLVDVQAPVIRFQTETEMLAFFLANTGRQLETGEPGGPKIRTYEMAGGVHVDLQLETTGLLIRERDMGFSPEPTDCPLPVIPISVSYIQSALLRATEVWIRDGFKAPPSVLIELGLDEKMNDVVIVDENGNAVGGIRSPQIEVPLGQYIAHPYAVGPECYLNGAFVEFDNEKFRQLYPTDTHYFLEVSRTISRAVADGFVLPEDAEELRQIMLADAGVPDIADDSGSSSATAMELLVILLALLLVSRCLTYRRSAL